jgi:ribose transport system substrate-binding protein
MYNFTRLRVLAVTIAATAIAVSIGACGSSSNSSSSGSVASGGNGGGGSSSGKTYKIVMSNGFVSTWRTEMQNMAKAMASKNAPYKGHVDLSIVVSQPTPTSQIQSINNIITEHPDAILIDALSPTALNPVVQRACSMNIVVVYFDQYGPEMNKCAYRVHNDEAALFENNATWLAKTLHGKGNIIEDEGLPGSPVSTTALTAAASVFKNYPGIHVVGKYVGNYTPGPSKQAVTNLLTSTKNVNGVYGIAGVDGAVEGFQATNTKMVPMTNYGDISVNLIHLINADKSKGLQFSMAENGPALAGQGLEVAWDALTKTSPFADSAWGFTQGTDSKDVVIPKVAYNTNGIAPLAGFAKTSYSTLQKTATGLPITTQLPFSLTQSPVSAKDALSG